jgi:uncharacterized protein YtpQ (UPF0354 family)
VDVMSTTFLPVLLSLEDLDPRDESALILDPFVGGIVVGYAIGPEFRSLLTWAHLQEWGIRREYIRQFAYDCLAKWAVDAQVVGQPPAPMVSFGGWESCILLCEEFWDRLVPQVPGELIVGVPARDVVMITGSGSRPGMEKVRRAVDRLYYAGGRGLLSRDLLVWRRGWEVWRGHPLTH